MNRKEMIEILKELEKESFNVVCQSGRIVFNSPGLFSFTKDYKLALAKAIEILAKEKSNEKGNCKNQFKTN